MEKNQNNSFAIPESLSQRISSFLENKIIAGEMEAGTRLVPDEIAEMLKVSKSPVREALLHLQKEGLVTNIPRVGFFVADISLDDIEEIYPIRAALLSLTVKSIIEKANISDIIGQLEDFIAKMDNCVVEGNVKKFFSLNVQLYNYYSDHCHNYRLRDMINQLGKQVLRFRHLGMTPPGRIKRSFELNKALVSAIKDKDSLSAVKYAEQIIYEGLISLRTLLDKE